MTRYKICPECGQDMLWEETEQSWVCYTCYTKIETTENDYDGDDDDNEIQSEGTLFDGAVSEAKFGDGTIMRRINDPEFREVYNDIGMQVTCPNCPDGNIYFWKGEFVCIDCESTFTRKEIEDYAEEIFF